MQSTNSHEQKSERSTDSTATTTKADSMDSFKKSCAECHKAGREALNTHPEIADSIWNPKESTSQQS